MEERYWQVLKALDRDSYLALWDEDFVGWPYALSAPIHKGPIRANPVGLFSGNELKGIGAAVLAAFPRMTRGVARSIVHNALTISRTR